MVLALLSSSSSPSSYNPRFFYALTGGREGRALGTGIPESSSSSESPNIIRFLLAPPAVAVVVAAGPLGLVVPDDLESGFDEMFGRPGALPDVASGF